jgi:hypothetical protein
MLHIGVQLPSDVEESCWSGTRAGLYGKRRDQEQRVHTDDPAAQGHSDPREPSRRLRKAGARSCARRSPDQLP